MRGLEASNASFFLFSFLDCRRDADWPDLRASSAGPHGELLALRADGLDAGEHNQGRANHSV